MNNDELVNQQYGTEPLLTHIEEALERAGLSHSVLQWSDLVPLDQLHLRGLAASKEQAAAMNPAAGSTLLDIGCGLGGPARFVAATYGCHVTGIDLNRSFVDAATWLVKRCEMSESISILKADALALPFDEASFDYAWTQHVAMNIANRTKFYAEVFRVLKPGGRFAAYDILAGEGRPLIYPVPWARKAEQNFLLTAEAMRELLHDSGFCEVSWTDKTEASLAWITELQPKLAEARPLGPPVVMGTQFGEMAENLRRNLHEGRVQVLQAILERAAQ